MNDPLIVHVEHFQNKIIEIVVRPNFSGSDEQSILFYQKVLLSKDFCQRTGITQSDLEYGLPKKEAISILVNEHRLTQRTCFVLSELEADLIYSELGIRATFKYLSHIRQDLPHLGEETTTEKYQKLLEKIDTDCYKNLLQKKSKKYIIEIQRE